MIDFNAMAEKYTVSNIPIETLLGYIKSGEIAIPEIQRPFVWKPRQVRDLIDSLYTGYPIGYLLKRVNLAKSKDELFSVHELIKTLRNMDMTFIGGEGYLPAYTRTELTNRLHGSSGFRTDYQITTKRMMNTIIFTLLSLTGHRWDYLTAKVKRGLSERSLTVSQRLNPENKAAVSAGRASFCSTKSRPPGRRSSKAQSEMAL